MLPLTSKVPSTLGVMMFGGFEVVLALIACGLIGLSVVVAFLVVGYGPDKLIAKINGTDKD